MEKTTTKPPGRSGKRKAPLPTTGRKPGRPYAGGNSPKLPSKHTNRPGLGNDHRPYNDSAPTDPRLAEWRAVGWYAYTPEERLKILEIVEDAGTNGLPVASIMAVLKDQFGRSPSKATLQDWIKTGRIEEVQTAYHVGISRYLWAEVRPVYKDFAIETKERGRISPQWANWVALVCRLVPPPAGPEDGAPPDSLTIDGAPSV